MGKICNPETISKQQNEITLYNWTFYHFSTVIEISTFLSLSLGTYDGGILVHEGIICPVVSALELTWFIRYTFSYIWNLQFLNNDLILIFGVLTPISTIFQLYHGDQF